MNPWFENCFAKDSFAWKDSTLDRRLKELKEKKLSEAPEPRNRWVDTRMYKCTKQKQRCSNAAFLMHRQRNADEKMHF